MSTPREPITRPSRLKPVDLNRPRLQLVERVERVAPRDREGWRERRIWNDQKIDVDKLPKTEGARICRWINKACRIPEGKYIGHNVQLLDWQIKLILDIYDNPHGTRRAILSFPRKNAKALSNGYARSHA